MGRWQDRSHGLLPLLAVLPLLAYPPLEWRAAAWVGLAPLLLSIRHGRGSTATWLAAGWGYGALFYAVQYAWVSRTLLELGGVPVMRFTVFAVAGLSFVALFPAIAVAGSRWGWARWGISPYWSFPLLFAVQDAVLGVFPFGGAPWGSLAGTQTGALAAGVLVPFAGGSALVLLIAAVNGGWAWAAEAMARSTRQSLPRLAALGVVTLALAPAWSLGVGTPGEQPGFAALLITGNFMPAPSGTEGGAERLRGFVSRTLKSSSPLRAGDAGGGEEPDDLELVIWPESAARGYVESGKQLVELSQLATALDADLLLGSDSRRRGREFNSAYLVLGGRFDFRRYDKRELVPFGEYVPAGFRWFFGKKVTVGEDDYAAGQDPPVLPWRGRRIGLGICFESILPGHMRTVAREGAETVVVIANDQWLTPPARLQHLRLTALRALEIGRDVLFVSNGGWSAHLAGGRVQIAVHETQEGLRARPALRRERTPWVRWGYGPLLLLLAAYAAAGLAARGLARKAR